MTPIAIVFMIISLCLPGGVAAYSVYVQFKKSKEDNDDNIEAQRV